MRNSNTVFFCLNFIFIMNCINAQNDQEVFLQANNYFDQKEYARALENYELILKKGRAAWFNMGICYDQLGDFAHSYLCLKRAQKQSSISECKKINEVLDVLSIKHNKAYDDSLPYKTQIVNWVELHFSFLDLQLLFLVCWYLLFFCMNRLSYKFFNRLLCFLLGFFSLLFAVGIIVKYNDLKHPAGIVMHETSLLAGPNKDYHVLGNLVSTDHVNILNQQPDWYKVQYGSRIGWVDNKDIEII